MLKVSTNNPIKRYKPIVRKGVYFYITKFYSVSLFCFSQFEAHSTQVSCFKFKLLEGFYKNFGATRFLPFIARHEID